MEWKSCNDCEHSLYEYDGCQCTRYPSWMRIYRPNLHWCGEWKKKEDTEEEEEDN